MNLQDKISIHLASTVGVIIYFGKMLFTLYLISCDKRHNKIDDYFENLFTKFARNFGWKWQLKINNFKGNYNYEANSNTQFKLIERQIDRCYFSLIQKDSFGLNEMNIICWITSNYNLGVLLKFIA